MLAYMLFNQNIANWQCRIVDSPEAVLALLRPELFKNLNNSGR